MVASLRAGGYGRSMKNMNNAVYTAMTRRPDMFEKVEAGTWAVKEQAKDAEE